MGSVSTEQRAEGRGQSKPRVVFFGSGPVAAKSLELLAKEFEIEAVVTKPKPAHHHGYFPVLDLAESLNLKFETVSNKAELSALMAKKPFTSEVGVLIDFGIIVSQDVIDYFPKGIVNSHFSMLPEWRGADPITFSILSGQSRTGVSLMLLVEKMDEGPLIACGVQEIEEHETTPTLTEKLIYLSDALLKKELPRYLNGETKAISQWEMVKLIPDYPTNAEYSRKLTKEDGRIDWSKSAGQIEREIRAYAEWPKSTATFAEREVIITKARAEGGEQRAELGKPFKTSAGELAVQTGDGILIIDKLKPAGKKVMTAKEFIAGYMKS